MSRTLADRIVEVHAALADTPHAFGGALALAYYAEPRATIDIDLNVFLKAHEYPSIAQRLDSIGVAASTPRVLELVARDSQVRVFWDDVPIDIFLSYDPFHDAAARALRTVPFDTTEIAVLSPEHLMVCKVVFNRGKDWVDLEAILDSGTPIDTAEVLRWVGRIVGDVDARFTRAVSILTRR